MSSELGYFRNRIIEPFCVKRGIKNENKLVRTFYV